MDERQRIDLRQHTSPPVSKWYLLRIIIYVVILILLGVFIYALSKHKKTPEIPLKNQEIRGVEISL